MAKKKTTETDETVTMGTPKPRKTPKSQALPSMEQVRHTKIDNAAEHIAEYRADMNECRTQEQTWISTALREMQAAGVMTYKHAGVELVRVPGDEKLRVRSLKDGGENAEGQD